MMQDKTNLCYLFIDLSLIQTLDSIPLQVSIAVQTSKWSVKLRDRDTLKSLQSSNFI